MNKVLSGVFIIFLFVSCKYSKDGESTFKSPFYLINNYDVEYLVENDFEFSKKGDVQFLKKSNGNISIEFLLMGGYLDSDSRLNIADAEIYEGNYFISCDKIDSISVSEIVQGYDADIISGITKLKGDTSYFFVRNRYSNVVFVCYIDLKRKKIAVPIYQLFFSTEEINLRKESLGL
jgi:hypothetical protein